MEKINKIHMPFSKKCIPIPSNKEYLKKSFNAVASLCRRMAWRAAIEIRKENGEEMEETDYFGFKSHRAPPPEGVEVVKEFTEKMMDLFTNIKFRRSYHNEFQNEMEEWLSNITSEKKIR